MKSIYKLSVMTLALGSLLGSCGKDFLDLEPSGLVTKDQIAANSTWNASLIKGQLLGAIQTTFKKGQALPGNPLDFGQKSLDLQTDVFSSDMELLASNYGLWSTTSQLTSTTKEQLAYAYIHWSLFYKVIFTSNGLLETFNETNLQIAENKNYYGQALVLRAYAYYQLSQLYVGAYQGNEDKAVLPIYTKVGDAKPASPLREVYAQILDDLSKGIQAIEEAGLARESKSMIDADVAKAYLAYVYLEMGDYDKAYQTAKQVINGGKYSLIPLDQVLESGFNSVDNPEFIWAMDITTENTGDLTTFWGQIDVWSYSYASAGGDYLSINQDLYESIPESDRRKQWFDAQEGYPLNKFFTQLGRVAFGHDQALESDIHYMRLADMYLVAMEAAARGGDDASAKALLKTLLAQRIEADSYAAVAAEVDAASHAALLEQILYNWRIEMWGEGRALAVKRRFSLDPKRSTRALHYPGQSYSITDERIVFQTPEREITNNPYINN